MSKGSAVIIEGKLELKQWEKDGRQYSKLIVLAENVQFLSSRKENQDNQPQGRSNNHRPVDNAYAPPPMPEADGDYPPPDDDIPF